MEPLPLKDQCVEVLVRWKEHKKERRQKIKKSPEHKGWFELMDQGFGRLVAGCMILLSEIPLFYPCFRYIKSSPGSRAEVIGIVLITWWCVGMLFLASAGFPSLWKVLFRWGDDLFAAAGGSYDRDRAFVEALAKDVHLEVSAIGRRLKGEIEVREKASAALAIVAGGASFSSLVPICEALARGKPSPWIALPALGLAAATILLQTLFISARLKGHLLICLEEVEELRKMLRTRDSIPDQRPGEWFPTYDNSRLRLADSEKMPPCVPIASSDIAGESRIGAAAS